MGEQPAKCVLLADRHHGLSEGIRGLLGVTFGKIFLVANEESLTEGVALLQPAVVVVDLSFGAGDIYSLVRALHALAPDTRILLLSVHDEPTVMRSAVASGADGVVLKRAIASDLLRAVDEVLAGKKFFSSINVR